MKKLLIADTGEEFAAALREALQAHYCVEVCRDGATAFDLLKTFCPDVLILDLLLPGIDGITLLRKPEIADSGMTVMVVTSYAGNHMTDVLERLNVGYVMLKPCAVDAVVQRLADLMLESMPAADADRPLQRSVEEMLHRLSVPVHQRGYACLREVLMEELRNPGQQVTKTLYPAVAKKCNGSLKQVERAIRCVILKAWAQRDEAVWQELFPAKRGVPAECPTNKAFIAAVADRIASESSARNTYLRKIG